MIQGDPTAKSFKTSKLKQVLSGDFLRLGREISWLTFGQGISVLGGIVGIRLLTDVLDPISYGELALATTLVTFVQKTVSGPLGGSFLRFFASAREENQLDVYLHIVRVLLKQVTIALLCIVGLLGLGLAVLGYEKWIWLTLGTSLYALLSGYSTALGNIQNAARHRAIVVWHRVLGQWLRYLAAVGLIVLWGSSSSIAMLGYVVSAIVVLGSQFHFFRRKIVATIPQFEAERAEVDKSIRQMRDYAWPFSTWGMFTWAQSSSDRWALQVFSMTGDVGLYAVLYQLGFYPIVMLSNLMMQFISPIFFEHAGSGSSQSRMKRTHHLNNLLILGSVAFTVLATILAFLLHNQLFLVVVAPEYREVSSLLPWLVLSGGLFASGQSASLLLMTDLNSQGLIIPKVSTALLGVVLNFAGAYWGGIQGVVFSSVVYSLLHLLWIMYLGLVKSTSKSG